MQALTSEPARLFLLTALALGTGIAGAACSSDDGGGANDGVTAGSGGASGDGGPGAGGSGAGTGGAPSGPTPALPTATGTCPEFHEGMANFTAGGSARTAQIYIDDAAAAAADGPIVFYWYGTFGQPAQAIEGLGAAGIQRIKDAGGMVIAPVHVNAGTFPWLGGGDLDYQLMDEVVGCARSKVGIDARHIHSVGFSAGALHTAQVSFSRSNYIASVATYSGGGTGTPVDPENKYAAMILFGGQTDMVLIKFADASHQFYDAMTSTGHFAFLCDHGGGHMIPPAAVPSVVQFLFDHPYGTDPSPYESGLPADFPAYCTL